MENYHSFPLILFHLQENQNCKKNHTSRAGSNLKTASFPLPSSFSTNPNPVAAGRQLRIFLSYQLFFFSSLFSSRGLPIRAPCASPLVVAVTIEDHHLSPAPNPPPPPPTTTTTTRSPRRAVLPHAEIWFFLLLVLAPPRILVPADTTGAVAVLLGLLDRLVWERLGALLSLGYASLCFSVLGLFGSRGL